MPRKRNLQHAKEPPACPDGMDSRRCLRCGGWFCSGGAGNRQCSKCFDDTIHVSKRQQTPGTTIVGGDGINSEEY